MQNNYDKNKRTGLAEYRKQAVFLLPAKSSLGNKNNDGKNRLYTGILGDKVYAEREAETENDSMANEGPAHDIGAHWPNNRKITARERKIEPRVDFEAVLARGLNVVQALPENNTDDQNAWGEAEPFDEKIKNIINGGGTEKEEVKYGPGNYPTDEEYRNEGFYANVLTNTENLLTWIVPDVLAIGAHPIYTSHQTDLAFLKKEDINSLVSVFNNQLGINFIDGFEYLHVPTVEAFSNSLMKVCKFIDAQARLGKATFVFSLKGKGRAATVAAAYLLYKQYLEFSEEAISYIRAVYHKEAIETTYQEVAIKNFASNELKIDIVHTSEGK